MGKSGRYAPGARKGKPDPRLRTQAAQKLRADNQALRNKVQKQDAEIAKLTADYSSLRSELNKQGVANTDLNVKCKGLEGEVVGLRDRVRRLETLYKITADELKKEVNARLADCAEELPPHIQKVWDSLR